VQIKVRGIFPIWSIVEISNIIATGTLSKQHGKLLEKGRVAASTFILPGWIFKFLAHGL
jgi:hypothetical protein